MSAHVVIDETADGWTVEEAGLEGKHVLIVIGSTGIDVAIDDTSVAPPLQVSLSKPLEGN